MSEAGDEPGDLLRVGIGRAARRRARPRATTAAASGGVGLGESRAAPAAQCTMRAADARVELRRARGERRRPAALVRRRQPQHPLQVEAIAALRRAAMQARVAERRDRRSGARRPAPAGGWRRDARAPPRRAVCAHRSDRTRPQQRPDVEGGAVREPAARATRDRDRDRRATATARGSASAAPRSRDVGDERRRRSRRSAARRASPPATGRSCAAPLRISRSRARVIAT